MTDSVNEKGNTMSDDTLTHAGMLSEEDFLAHVGATPEMTEDEFLEHFGVKGMRWGHSNASSGGGSDSAGGGGRRPKLGPDGAPAKTRKELRGLNKASAKKDRDQLDSDIDAARARIKSGENKANLKSAKTQFKSDKKIIGSREARKALNSVREKNLEDYNTSQLAKSGKETVLAVVGAIAGTALVSYALANS